MFTELLYPLQYGYTPLHYAAKGCHTTCVEHLLSTPGIDLTIGDMVSWSMSDVSLSMHLHVRGVTRALCVWSRCEVYMEVYVVGVWCTWRCM